MRRPTRRELQDAAAARAMGVDVDTFRQAKKLQTELILREGLNLGLGKCVDRLRAQAKTSGEQ